MTITLARPTYTRRPVNGDFDNGFFQDEHALIQQAIPVNVAKTVTADYTATVQDDLIEVDATGGVVTVALLDPTRVAFLKLTIKKVDSSANAVTIGGTVDGVSNPTLTVQYASQMIMSDGVAWRQISGSGTSTAGTIASATSPILYNAGTRVISHATSGVSASTYGDSTHVAQVAVDVDGHVTSASSVAIAFPGGSGLTASHRATDVSTSGGSFVTSGLTLTVANTESWSARWVLWLGTSAGASGGISFQITKPTAGAQRGVAFGVKSGSTTSVVSSASTVSLAASFANADFSASDAWVTIDASFDAFSAGGTVDLQFRNDGAAETAIIRRVSSMWAVKT